MNHIFTVSQINSYIRRIFDGDYALRKIEIKGEVSNCKYHSSGHIYFTLKDYASSIRCVMFQADRYRGLSFRLENGQQIQVQGNISVYERDGTYQLYAKKITQAGIGELYLRYEALKKELAKEGYFDFERKKELPRFPNRIGIVTAATGAAIQDIRSISARRNPFVQLILYPAKVQGEGAAASIAAGIRYFDCHDVDLIIVGRGGGSIEDLWAFNEREVADAIFGAKTPLISGTGHEIDMTIADYCADLRAATPSAAVELAVPDIRAVLQQMDDYRDTLDALMERKLDYCRQKYNQYARLLKGHDPAARIQRQRILLQNMEERMHYHINTKLQEEKHRLKLLGSRLTAASPSARLQGGYVFAQDSKERPLSSVTQLNKEQPFDLIFADGFATVKPLQINEIKNEDQ
ncbi:MAG: exodeoxyribonuclease VII large subunit [Eubacterium sp.]|nr:exodeoxyribonuclease VII large subunit [Eubacterium sp.]